MINIYKASAGSGKTFTLAREFIKLILGHKNEDGEYMLNRPGSRSGHRAVLAMTFTNKATEEMKSRIIHELAVLAGCEKDWDGKSPYQDDLCKVFRCNPEQLSVAAKDTLSGLLYDFSRFSVSTIDSFFQTVLRAFAHEADVSSNYALELDDEAVITMSVDQLLQSLNHGKPSGKSHEIETWITGYMKSLVDQGAQFTLFNRSGNVQSELIRFIAKIHDDTFKDNETQILEYLTDSKRFPEFCKVVFNSSDEIRQATARLCSEALSAINGMADADKLVSKNVISYLKNWSVNGWYKEIGKTVTNVAEEPVKMWSAAAKKSGMMPAEVETAVVMATNSILDCYSRVSTLNVIKKNLYQLGLLSVLLELIDRFRRENSTLLLSDTNSLLSHIIGGDDSPFLYEKLGVRYHHYLIDEFQDTSHSQWANMRPLLKESLSYGYDNLVIGDEKQCIYRFRNSDPSLLHNLHTEDWAKGHTEVHGEDPSENTNWRSSSDVVRFNNALFTSIARQYELEDVYSNVVQQVSPKHENHHGYIMLSCFDPKTDSKLEALEQLARELRRQLESGYRPGDIAILVRRTNEGEEIIRYLEELRLEDPTYPVFDIISDKSLKISSSDAVNNIISRLRMLSSVDITSGRHSKSNREVARVLNDYEQAFTSGASPEQALARALENMRARGVEGETGEEKLEDETLHGVDLISLVESIISTNIDPSLRQSDSAYITAFVDLLAKFVGQGHADIRSFLQWWDDSGCEISIAGSSDNRALNILTVHKSKGLEFACVHIPFAEFSTSSTGDIGWFEIPHIDGIPDELLPPMMPISVSKALVFTPFAEQYEEIKRQQLLDQTNLLYVAFTRAVDELIVGVKVTDKLMKDALAPGDIPTVARSIYEGVMGAGTSEHMPLKFDENLQLIIGEPTVKSAKDEVKEKGTAMRPSESMRLPAYESTSSESVWKNTNVDTRRLNHIEVARERGLILHGLMSQIRESSDVDRAFTLLMSSPDARNLTDEDIKAMREIIDRRVNDSRAAKWFDGYKKVYLEREILTADGRQLRIDRVVNTADGELHVIDYKSGSQDPKKYRKQVRDYMQFFRSIGYPQVQGFLYYLDTGDIVEIEL